MTDDYTEDDLYAEVFNKFIAAGDDTGIEPNTRTRPEIMAEFGVSRTTAKVILDEMIEAGVITKDKVRRHDGWRSALVNGYRLVEE